MVSVTKCLGEDGTYKVGPQLVLFHQLFNIVVEFKDTFIPVTHSVMPNKSETFYEIIFIKLKELIGFEWKPAQIMCDFKKAVFNAI
jgi:hypothetical protein